MIQTTLETMDLFGKYDPNEICHLIGSIVFWDTTCKKAYFIKYAGTQRVNININIMKTGTKQTKKNSWNKKNDQNRIKLKKIDIET
jgi:hypothetical protein